MAQQAPPKVEFTLAEARALARSALVQGQPELALSLGRGLLQANPQDADAHLIVSAALTQLQQSRHGRHAAKLAYRHAEVAPQKLDAAMLAARNALVEGRPTLTQIWLRRASLHAQTDEQSKQIAKDYSNVRSINPWNVYLDFGLRPSSNVNNGSDSALQIIDGVPFVGFISGAGRALSGTIAHTDARLSYRLDATKTSRTDLGGRLLVQRVRLSEEARAIAPTSENRDFGSTYADLSLTHAFSAGQKPGEYVQITGRLGAAWYGEDRSYTLTQLQGQRVWQPTETTRFSLGGTLTHRDAEASPILDSRSVGVRGSVAQDLPNGDEISFTLGVENTTSEASTLRYQTVSVQTQYSFGQQLGPAEITAGLALASTDYPDYVSGFIVVPGGRQDKSAYASLNLFFPDYDYAGFAPEVTFRASKRGSNVSRFDSSEFTVSFGVQSKF